MAVVVTSAAAVTGWLLLDDGRDDDGTVTEGAVAEVCPTPEGAAWTALTTTLYDGDFIEDRWSLLLRGGGYRPLADGDGWEVVLRPRLVNRGDVAVSHRNIYRFVVDNVAAEPTCFQVQSGPEIIGPGQISDALVGFKVDQEPLGTTALDADDGGQHMRVPVSVSAT